MKRNPDYRSRTPFLGGPVLLLGVMAPFLSACTSSTEPLVTLWETTLSPVAPSRITGQAAALTQFGRTEVSVEIRLADPESAYPWRVESGTCTTSGNIQDGPAVYIPLSTGEAGTAGQTVTLSSKFRPGDKLSVKVFAPGSSGSQDLVACGVLEEV